MTGISGCATATNHTDTTSSTVTNSAGAIRTAEEAAVEAEFAPLFKFLEAEKKDFSNISKIISGLKIIHSNVKKETIEDNSLLFKTENVGSSKLSGYFAERLNGTEVKYNVSISSENDIVFENSAPNNFSENLYLIVTSKQDIVSGNITNYSTDHKETELETVSYSLSPEIPIFQLLTEKYNIQPENIDDASLSISKFGNTEFSAQFYLVTKDKYYILSTDIFLKNWGEQHDTPRRIKS